MNKCIISFNCAGAVIYNKLNEPYATPFIGHLFRSDEDFLKFCLNLQHYLNATPKIITKSKYPRYGGVSNKNYVITKHDDIEIHWIHDYNPVDVIEKFNYRKIRIYYIDADITQFKWNNIMVVFSETCLGKDKKDPEKFKKFIKRFSEIPFNKVFFSSREINIDGVDTEFVRTDQSVSTNTSCFVRNDSVKNSVSTNTSCFVTVVPKWKDKKFWEKCGEDFNCRNGTCPGCGRTSYGNYGGVAEQYIKFIN